MPLTATTPGGVYTVLYSLAPGDTLETAPPASAVLLAYQPNKTITRMVDVMESIYFGRKKPVAEYGQARFQIVQFSFFLPWSDPAITVVPGGQYADRTYKTENPGWLGTPTLDLLDNIIANQQDFGRATVIKDPTGYTWVGHIGNLQIARVPPRHYMTTFTFSELDTTLIT